MINKIILIISENKPGYIIDADVNLIDSGVLDSFDLLILVTELESQLNIIIPGEMLVPENFETPSSINRMIEALKEETK
jgi:D-alanine--poly(phosphoribitol) ligase subunit 2